MIIITIPRRESQDTKFNRLRHKMSTQVKSNKRVKATNTGATNEPSSAAGGRA
jgi:hypothetical protein